MQQIYILDFLLKKSSGVGKLLVLIDNLGKCC